MKTHLIFGSSGAIGKLIAQTLKSKGHPFVALSRREGLTGFLCEIPVDNENAITRMQFGDVYLLASSLKVQTPQMLSRELRLTDYRAYESLLKTIRYERLIFFSSAGAIYGPSRSNHGFREDDALSPVSEYGKSKEELELLVERETLRTGSKCVVLRVANPIGCYGANLFDYGIVPALSRCALRGTAINVTVPVNYEKDYFPVSMLERVIETISDNPRIAGTLNIGSGIGTSIAQLISFVEGIVGQNVKINLTKEPVHAEVESVLLNVDRLKQLLGDVPWPSTQQCVSKVVDLLRTHETI